ncbi:MAG: VTT domain-containing protein [Marinobacter sp.]|uniref:VTT domain-containing protein n=1 Tax=Marinobacter sp. TaxID=50741 RepID=UPI003297DF83
MKVAAGWRFRLGLVAAVALLMALAVVGPIPTLPVSAASGLAFGVLMGTVLAAAGALTGAMIAFSVARLLGRESLKQKLSATPVFASDDSQRLLFWAVFLTRLIPLLSFALISYAAEGNSERS